MNKDFSNNAITNSPVDGGSGVNKDTNLPEQGMAEPAKDKSAALSYDQTRGGNTVMSDGGQGRYTEQMNVAALNPYTTVISCTNSTYVPVIGPSVGTEMQPQNDPRLSAKSPSIPVGAKVYQPVIK